MSQEHFTTTFSVTQPAEQVFRAIHDVRGWWSGEVEGHTDRLGAEFTYRYKSLHCSRQKVTELVPGRRVVWHVVDSQLTFLKDNSEWNGTDIIFEIAGNGGQTEVRFTHAGLSPRIECYSQCSNAWGLLIGGNLLQLITTGKAQPDAFA